MQYHKQLNKHDPKNGIYGDCYRTAIACILDKNPTDVPHVFDLDDLGLQNKMMREFLDGLGLRLLNIAYSLDSISDVLKVGENNIGEMHWILCGMSEREINHCVVCFGGTMIHDPHPSGSFLTGPSDDGYWHTEIIVRPV